MRGAPGKSVEQHKREGTHRPDRHGETPVTIGGRERPVMPPDFSEAQAECWSQLVDDLWDSGTYDAADAATLEMAAALWGRAREARRELNGQELVLPSKEGAPTMNAYFRVERDAWSAFRQIAEQLGLSPAARARLGIASVKKRTMEADINKRIGESPRALRSVDGGRGA